MEAPEAVGARKPVRKRLGQGAVALRYRLLNNRLVDSSLLDKRFFDIGSFRGGLQIRAPSKGCARQRGAIVFGVWGGSLG